MLNINWSTLLLQILNFTVMAIILARFFFRPVLRILDERSQRVTSALTEAEEKTHQAEEMRAQYEERLNNAQEQIVAMRQQAEGELARARRQVLDETRQELESMRTKAQDEFQEARQQAIAQHQRQLGELVTDLSARLIRESTDKAYRQANLELFLTQLAGLPDETYRRALADDEQEAIPVELRSAEELDAQTTERIRQLIAGRVGRPVEIRASVDPALVAGATVRFGDVVVDGSIAGQLKDLRERYMAGLEQGTG